MHATQRTLTALLLASNALPGVAQIIGKVVDKATAKPIHDAEVFINHSTLSVHTNKKGEFRLDPISNSMLEVVVYKKGYGLFRSPGTFKESKLYQMNLELIPENHSVKDAYRIGRN